MTNPAVLADLAERWYPNPLGDSDAAANATVRLDEAWRALLSEVPSLAERLDVGLVDVATVIDVVCAAALRVLRNPDNRSQMSESIDDYSTSWQVDRAALSNDLFFTAAELRRLTPGSQGAFTIRPQGAPCSTPLY